MSAPAYRFARRAAILGKSVFDHEPGTIMLNSGSAYPPCLPDVVQEATDSFGALREESMQYGPLMGLDDLREEICRFVAEDGVEAKPENVLVTYGAKNALDLACRAFLEPGDKVIVTQPTYMTALHIMRMHDIEFLSISQDEEGFCTDELELKLARLEKNAERMPKLLFDVPDFHNPTGVTTSLARRKRMVELAQRHHFVICEDDPYRRIRFEGESVPSIKSLDSAGVVIALGTVSKILAPGLRVGWAIGDAGVVRRMALQKADGGSNTSAQRIVAQLMRTDKMAKHIDEVTQQMRIHRDVMLAALAEHLPDCEIRKPEGGYFLWLKMPEGVDADQLVNLGVEEGVEVSSGRLSFAGDDPGNFLRTAYSFVTADEICDGIAKLGVAYAKYRQVNPAI